MLAKDIPGFENSIFKSFVGVSNKMFNSKQNYNEPVKVIQGHSPGRHLHPCHNQDY